MQPTKRRAVDGLARWGLLVYGLVHLLVAWLVLRLALGDPAGPASGGGAMRALAQSTPGRLALLAVAIGFAALAVWNAVEAWSGSPRPAAERPRAFRLAAGFKVVGFLAVGAYALGLTAGGTRSGSSGTDRYAAIVMGWPAGPWIVGTVGLVIVAVGLGLTYFGAAERFREMLSDQGASGWWGRGYVRLGVVGYVSRGVAVSLVGLLFVYAAVTHDPTRSGGPDQVVQDLLEQPFGRAVLLAMSAGLASFGLFCLAWARHVER